LYGNKLLLPKDHRNMAQAALEKVSLLDLAGRPVNQLSGGQQQRVLIARALVREPELLIMDEPTAGVDLVSQELLVETLTTLRQGGTTLVTIMHETGLYADLVDRALVLSNG